MALYGKVASVLSKEGIVSGPREKRIGLSWVDKKSISNPYYDKNSGFQLIRDQVKQLVLTTKGERVMLPNFGTNLMNFLFEPFTSDLVALLATDLQEGISRYIPNINVNYIRFFQSDNLHGFGMPGIEIQMSVSPKKSLDIINIKVKI
jgi:phage baseplate assembly protein W